MYHARSCPAFSADNHTAGSDSYNPRDAIQSVRKAMVKVILEGDMFKRLSRADMAMLQRNAEGGKFGIYEVAYGSGKIKIEIKKKGSDVVMKRFSVS